MAARLALAAAAILVVAVCFWPETTATAAPPSDDQARGASEAPAAAATDAPASRRELVEPEADAVDDPFADAFAELGAAIRAGEAAAAAAKLRKLLRTDPGALAAAYDALLSADTDADERRALAMVLGTLAIEGVDEVLLAAVEQFRDDPATVIALIAAMGALRDPPDADDVFDMEAAPHFAVHGPGGMGITVRNIIDDPAVEAKLGELLLDEGNRDIRLAAANALQFSVDREFTRTRFRTALAGEMDDAVAALLGQNLGVWTRRKLGEEAQHIVDEVVQVADRPGFDEYRLRMETALHQSSFNEDTMTQLRSWSQPGMPFEMRTFAFSVLLGQRPMPADSRATILAAAASDEDRAIRDHALGLLSQLPRGADSVEVLRRTYTGAADWSLRSTALTSLANVLTGDARRQLLQKAALDPDQRIARRARRLLGN